MEKVRGLPHRSEEFIRLADAIAGFVRDYEEGAEYAQSFHEQAVRFGVIEKLSA